MKQVHLIAVSYTHLDVYKRQIISQGKICSIISTIIIHFRKRRFCCGCVSYVRFWIIFIQMCIRDRTKAVRKAYVKIAEGQDINLFGEEEAK